MARPLPLRDADVMYQVFNRAGEQWFLIPISARVLSGAR